MAKAFLITPFTAERAGEKAEVFEAVQSAIAEAARRAGVTLVHPALVNRAGAIMQEQVQPEIETADVVLALITGHNPNVFIELGFARRDAILICRSSDDVPFDIRHHRYWMYGMPGELESLATRLEDAILQTLAAGERTTHRHYAERPRVTVVNTVAAFVGPTERGPVTPVLITGPAEFIETFGDALPSAASFLAEAVVGYFANGGKLAYIARVNAPDAATASATLTGENQPNTASLRIAARSIGAWGNRIRVHLRPGTRTGWRLTVFCHHEAAEGQPEEEDYDNSSFDPAGPNPLVERVKASSRLVRLGWLGSEPRPLALEPSRVVLAGGADGTPPQAEDYLGASPERSEARGIAAIAALEDVDLICLPDHVHPSLSCENRRRITDAVIGLAERDGGLIALLATPCGEHDPELLKPCHDSRFAATYYPWIRTAGGALVPPIGHVAGAFARNDRASGVHWAPIGLILDGVGSPALERTLEPGPGPRRARPPRAVGSQCSRR